jgi:hypothetical protein
MTTDGEHPNYFIILGLDPAAPWDEEAIGKAISDKRGQWSKQTQGFKGTESYNAAKRGLGLISDIERVMRNPYEWKLHRQEALRQREDEAQAMRAEFAAQVDVILRKGFLWEYEYEKLRGDPTFLDADPRLEDTEKRPAGGQHAEKDSGRLDRSTESNLKANLRTVGKPDLYAVLRETVAGVSEVTPREELLAAAEKLYSTARNRADKNRPEIGARQQLAGMAQRVFCTDEMKERHDASTRLFPLDAMLTRYEQALDAAGAVDASQSEMFLREAAQKGIDVSCASDVFIAHFRGKNWRVDMPSSAAQHRLSAEAGQSVLEPVMAEKVREATDLMDNRRYNGALRELRSLRSRPPAVALLISECEKAVGESGRLYQEARAHGLDDEYRAQLYMQALKACADNSDAVDALARIPPPPPRGLRAEADPVDQEVRLAWEPVAGLSYSSVIYRADGPVPPAALSEWDRLAMLRSRGEWKDTKPLVGRPMWYAVYT